MKDIQASSDQRDDKESQRSLVAAMMEPGFYPKPPSKVTHKETHISYLFFAGDLVYKVKKAVRYSFLDYSTLTKRRYFLNEELRLNRRLAPSVYLGVMPITLDASGWRLGGWAEPAEYTLVMRRLPEKRMLPFLLETRQVTPEMMQELAGVLAKFHAEAERAKGIEPKLYPPLAEKQWDENLTDLNPLIGLLIDSETYEAVKRSGAGFIRDHAELLRRRAQEGWIREVHGDLHCDHICFAPEGIQVFDCIEFDPKLRCCDLAAEIAFFLMDLEVRGGQALAQPFLTRYRELLADQELPVLLPFYKCYRALVRAKVHALRPGGAVDAARYFRYATRLTWERLQPFLLIICGLTGSGKSTLASELGERLGLPVINSDTTRKALAGKPGRQAVPFGEGIYSVTMTERTYAKMTREAEKQILNGNGAILDATFGQRGNRGKVVRLAEKHRVRLFLIHCSAADEIIHGRLTQRAAQGKDTSDGRWEIYKEQRAAYEPITEVPAESCLELNTEAPLDQLAGACEKFLRSELDKVRPAG